MYTEAGRAGESNFHMRCHTCTEESPDICIVDVANPAERLSHGYQTVLQGPPACKFSRGSTRLTSLRTLHIHACKDIPKVQVFRHDTPFVPSCSKQHPLQCLSNRRHQLVTSVLSNRRHQLVVTTRKLSGLTVEDKDLCICNP